MNRGTPMWILWLDGDSMGLQFGSWDPSVDAGIPMWTLGFQC